jgi:hypothetical protein
MEMPKSIRNRAVKPFKSVKDFPGLNDDDYLIPQNVWVAGPRFEYADKLKSFLQRHENKTFGGAHDFADREDNPEDREGYKRLSRWASDLNVTPGKPQFVTLDGIHSLLAYHRSEYGPNESPRLAIVLSGGGGQVLLPGRRPGGGRGLMLSQEKQDAGAIHSPLGQRLQFRIAFCWRAWRPSFRSPAGRCWTWGLAGTPARGKAS